MGWCSRTFQSSRLAGPSKHAPCNHRSAVTTLDDRAANSGVPTSRPCASGGGRGVGPLTGGLSDPVRIAKMFVDVMLNMSDTAIMVEGLSKQYRLGQVQERYSTLRDHIQKWTSPRRLLRQVRR